MSRFDWTSSSISNMFLFNWRHRGFPGNYYVCSDVLKFYIDRRSSTTKNIVNKIIKKNHLNRLRRINIAYFFFQITILLLTILRRRNQHARNLNCFKYSILFLLHYLCNTYKLRILRMKSSRKLFLLFYQYNYWLFFLYYMNYNLNVKSIFEWTHPLRLECSIFLLGYLLFYFERSFIGLSHYTSFIFLSLMNNIL